MPEGREFDFLWVNWIFHLLNPSGHTMDMGSTLPLKGRSTIGGKEGRCVGLTSLPHSCADCLEILGASTSCGPKGLARPAMRLGQLLNFRARNFCVDFVMNRNKSVRTCSKNFPSKSDS